MSDGRRVRRWQRSVVATVAVLVAVLLAACSSSGGTTPAPGTASGGRTSVSASAPASAPASSSTAPSTASNTPSSNTAADFEARGLVAPAAPLASASSASPLAGLPFAVPGTQDAFSQLTAAQQARLRQALSTTRCAAPPPPTPTYRVTCGVDVGTRVALLTGPAIFGRDDISSARAVAPTTASGNSWTVALQLDATATAAWASYTTRFNLDGQALTPDLTGCGGGATATGGPCADFVAFIVGGAAVFVPVTESPITNGAVQIAGGLSESSAEKLATEIHE